MFFSYHFKVLYWGQRIYLVSMVNHLHTMNPLISFTGWQNNSKPSVRPVRLIKLLCLKCECTIFSILYLNPPCVHSICSLLFFLVREIIFLVTIFGLSLLKTSHSVMSESLGPHGLYSPWNSPGWNTGVGSLSLLQGIFPTQESKPGILHCGQILYQLSHKGSSGIPEWASYSFSIRSSQPRNRTGVFCIAGGSLTNGAMREALSLLPMANGYKVLMISYAPYISYLLTFPASALNQELLISELWKELSTLEQLMS